MSRSLLTIALVAALASGCRERGPAKRASASSAGAAGAVVVKDDLGRRLRLPRPARRIAALSPSNTEVLFAIGCGQRVVLRDSASDYPPPARALPATDPFRLSAEHIAGYHPDLVLFSHVDPGRAAAMERIGLTVGSFDPRTVEQLLSNIATIGELCGARQRAARLVAALRRRVAAVRERVAGRKRPRVYIELDGTDPSRPWTAGRGSLTDALLGLAGGSNAIDELQRPHAAVGVERVLRSNPDVIVLLRPDGLSGSALRERLLSRPGWSKLSAVRRDHVIVSIGADLLARPGPRLIDGLEALAAALHPPATAESRAE